jgi:hypothetical protein
MSKRTSPLDHVTVAAPCNVGWDNMIGNEQVRFCGQCNLNVYNLSGMTKPQAEHLVAQTEGRLCIRYYRRADGTILTKNCPVGLRALKRRLSRIANVSISAVLSFFAGVLAVTGLRELPLIPIAAQGAMINIKEKLPEEVLVVGQLVEPEFMGKLAPAYYRERWVKGRAIRASRRIR